MHPLDLARSLSSLLFVSLVGFSLSFITPERALAKSSGPAIEARISLNRLVRIAAMQADYGHPVEAYNGRQCPDEMAVAQFVEATKAPDGFPIDSQQLCRLASENHANGDGRTIIVQAKSGASCDKFKSTLQNFILKTQENSEFKIVSTHSINIENSSTLIRRAERYYRMKNHSVDCRDGKYSIQFPRRGIF